MNDAIPFVSVIVPAYNAETEIGACLGALLNQTYPRDKYEIVVVDNNSADGTAHVIRSYPVRAVSERRKQSSYAARNAGVRAAKGEIFAFTDADCIPSPDWIREGVAAFDAPDVMGVAGEIRGLRPSNRVEEYLVRKNPVKHSTQNRFLPFAITANVFYKRELFSQVGFFEEWTTAGDADYSWRVQLAGHRVRFISRALVFHRHRSTVKGMFKQFVKYGYGSARLHRKYRARMAAARLASPPPRVPRRRAGGVGELYFDAVTSLGWRLGRLIGSAP